MSLPQSCGKIIASHTSSEKKTVIKKYFTHPLPSLHSPMRQRIFLRFQYEDGLNQAIPEQNCIPLQMQFLFP